MKTVAFWRSPHVWGAVLLLGLTLGLDYLPAQYHKGILDVWGCAATLGIVSARQVTDSKLGLKDTPAEDGQKEGQ